MKIAGIILMWFCLQHPKPQLGEVTLRVDEQRLCQRLDLRLQQPAEGIYYLGIEYEVETEKRPLENVKLTLGVHPSNEKAEDAMARYRRESSSGAGRSTGSDVGDRRLIVGEPDEAEARILFRRRNVTVKLSWRGAYADGMALAQAIDEQIRDDRETAPTAAQFPEAPVILSTGVPAPMTASPPPSIKPAGGGRSQYTVPTLVPISPEFRGLGERQHLRIRICDREGDGNYLDSTYDGRSNRLIHVMGDRGSPTQRNRTADEDGRFQFVVPRGPMDLKLEMVVVNPDNVVVTKRFEVEVVARE